MLRPKKLSPMAFQPLTVINEYMMHKLTGGKGGAGKYSEGDLQAAKVRDARPHLILPTAPPRRRVGHEYPVQIEQQQRPQIYRANFCKPLPLLFACRPANLSCLPPTSSTGTRT